MTVYEINDTPYHFQILWDKYKFRKDILEAPSSVYQKGDLIIVKEGRPPSRPFTGRKLVFKVLYAYEPLFPGEVYTEGLTYTVGLQNV